MKKRNMKCLRLFHTTHNSRLRKHGNHRNFLRAILLLATVTRVIIARLKKAKNMARDN